MEKHNWIFEVTHKKQQGSEIVAVMYVGLILGVCVRGYIEKSNYIEIISPMAQIKV
jgi:hypothetical protein